MRRFLNFLHWWGGTRTCWFFTGLFVGCAVNAQAALWFYRSELAPRHREAQRLEAEAAFELGQLRALQALHRVEAAVPAEYAAYRDDWAARNKNRPASGRQVD